MRQQATLTKIIASLMLQHKGADAEDVAKLIAEAIDESNQIAERMDKLSAGIEAEEKRRKQTDAYIKHELAEIQRSCPHLAKTYHSDASGNNDSFHKCDLCGEEE